MRIRFTLDALAHVDAIHHYVELRSVYAAARITERIFTEIDRLGRFSNLGHLGIVLGTLEWTVSGLPYIIVFERNDEEIIVLGIFHSRRARSPSR
jgi:toxin ParE1/3/4